MPAHSEILGNLADVPCPTTVCDETRGFAQLEDTGISVREGEEVLTSPHTYLRSSESQGKLRTRKQSEDITTGLSSNSTLESPPIMLLTEQTL